MLHAGSSDPDASEVKPMEITHLVAPHGRCAREGGAVTSNVKGGLGGRYEGVQHLSQAQSGRRLNLERPER